MKKMKAERIVKTEIISIEERTARQTYSCWACSGEVPMPKGIKYYSMKIKCTGQFGTTRFDTVRLCQRCREILRRKLDRAVESGKDLKLEAGAFRLDLLGKDDKAWWYGLLKEERARQIKERKAEIAKIIAKNVMEAIREKRQA